MDYVAKLVLSLNNDPFPIALFLCAMVFVFDWLQTLQIFYHPERWSERNPAIRGFVRMLGAPDGVHAWFFLVGLLFLVVLWFTTPVFRWVLTVAAFCMEAYWAYHNRFKNGILFWGN